MARRDACSQLPETATIRLPELAAQIRSAVADAEKAVQVTVEKAIEAGRALLEAKAILAHGRWLPWLEQHVELSDRQAQKYMRIATYDKQIRPKADLSINKALSDIADEAESTRLSEEARRCAEALHVRKQPRQPKNLTFKYNP
jgi:hypothetical protein